MTHALVTYYSHAGHTARIARVICETIQAEGVDCDLMDMAEASREGVVWEKYDLVIVGAAIIYGVYNKIVWEFIHRYQAKLDARANSFFNVTVVARTPYKATIEGNRYMQRFLQKSPWRPKDLKCIAGKVDYPNWNWYQKLAIQMIMKMTKGPTDPTSVIDYTDWDDVRAYAKHCLTLISRRRVAETPAPKVETVVVTPAQKVEPTVAVEKKEVVAIVPETKAETTAPATKKVTKPRVARKARATKKAPVEKKASEEKEVVPTEETATPAVMAKESTATEAPVAEPVAKATKPAAKRKAAPKKTTKKAASDEKAAS